MASKCRQNYHGETEALVNKQINIEQSLYYQYLALVSLKQLPIMRQKLPLDFNSVDTFITSFSKIICDIVASLNLRPFLAFTKCGHGNSSLSYAHRAK
jgi:hypothetical protein